MHKKSSGILNLTTKHGKVSGFRHQLNCLVEYYPACKEETAGQAMKLVSVALEK